MAVYYNEHEPTAAAWLRELMKNRLIPDGWVDDRDIQQVWPHSPISFVILPVTLAELLSGLLTSGSVFGGWPTASATDADRGGVKTEQMTGTSLQQVAALSGYPTAQAIDAGTSRPPRMKKDYKRNPLHPGNYRGDLKDIAAMAGFPTITATDAIKSGEVSPRPGMMGLSETAQLAGFPTAKASNSQGPRNAESILAKYAKQGRSVAHRLDEFAALAGYATPNLTDSKGGKRKNGSQLNQQVKRQEQLTYQIHGAISPPSLSATGKRGVLNPAFVAWLMGFPDAHLSCGVTAMQSFQKSGRSGSKSAMKRSHK